MKTLCFTFWDEPIMALSGSVVSMSEISVRVKHIFKTTRHHIRSWVKLFQTVPQEDINSTGKSVDSKDQVIGRVHHPNCGKPVQVETRRPWTVSMLKSLLNCFTSYPSQMSSILK